MIRKTLHLHLIENFFKKLIGNRVYLTIYLILILLIIIITLREQEKQETKNLETFIDSKFKNKFVKYSDCKKNCTVKYDDPDKVKVCKRYCKCKKTCASQLNSKKCLKGCKDIKMNIYRDDETKLEKMKLKKELKIDRKNEKKEQRIKEERELKEINKNIENKDSNTKSFLMRMINNASTENDKIFLLDLSSSTSRFYKDFRNIFRIK